MSRINLSKCEPRILCSADKLPKMVLPCLQRVALWVAEYGNVSSHDLLTISTRKGVKAIFAKMVHIWQSENMMPDMNSDYLSHAVKCVIGASSITSGEWKKLTNGAIDFLSTYRSELTQGFSLFLAELHSEKIVTLPYAYNWPRAFIMQFSANDGVERTYPLPCLFADIKLLSNDGRPEYKNYTTNQKWELVTVATKMLTALGWAEPEDANYEDLEAIFEFGKNNDLKKIRVTLLVGYLVDSYDKRVPITIDGWALRQKELSAKISRSTKLESIRERAISISDEGGDRGGISDDPLLISLAWEPGHCAPDKVQNIFGDALNANVTEWAKLEAAFISFAKYETTRFPSGIGYFNIYLMIYLPAWYEKNNSFRFDYPSNPNLLISSVFISDIGVLNEECRPLTFVQWLEVVGKDRKWSTYRWYALLKQLEVFFLFIVRNGSQLPNCDRFKQPLSQADFPRISRSSGTNKRPIPRRIFVFYMRYIEALMQYFEHILQLSLDGEISADDLQVLFERDTIDTNAVASLVGLVPVVQYQKKWHRLQYVPTVAVLNQWPLKVGGRRFIPELHSIYQIYVSLHTGLRQQHIQWLDVRTFDKENNPLLVDGPVVKLWVNTDKQKSSGWAPIVSSLVIETLRKQAAWRDLIDLPSFKVPIYYEGNPHSRWGLILPLFSASASDGAPHSDYRYVADWRKILACVNAFLLDNGEQLNLGQFRIVGCSKELMDYDYFERSVELSLRYAKPGGWSPLKFKTFITPHGARVSVVSNMVTYLPADVVGRYITGQTSATVNYYTVVDSDAAVYDMVFQREYLKDLNNVHKSSKIERGGEIYSSPFIKADSVNSALAKGMRENVDEAIVSFGCISMSISDISETGIDVLKRTRYAGAVENKTEICPYGNNCPPDILKLTNGYRKCAFCPYAVRSVDHLPAICAKGRQMMEKLVSVEQTLDSSDIEARYTSDEIDRMEDERSELAAEVTAWRFAEEVLERMRQQLEAGELTTRWVVGKPEIIEGHLKAVAYPAANTEGLLARLAECIEYPTFDSPLVKAEFDLLRRRILAKQGNIRDALSSKVPVSPADECVGLIRSVMAINQLSVSDVVKMITSDDHLQGAGNPKLILTQAVAL